jgi:hypothetical protein
MLEVLTQSNLNTSISIIAGRLVGVLIASVILGLSAVAWQMGRHLTDQMITDDSTSSLFRQYQFT